MLVIRCYARFTLLGTAYVRVNHRGARAKLPFSKIELFDETEANGWMVDHFHDLFYKEYPGIARPLYKAPKKTKIGVRCPSPPLSLSPSPPPWAFSTPRFPSTFAPPSHRYRTSTSTLAMHHSSLPPRCTESRVWWQGPKSDRLAAARCFMLAASCTL